MQTLTQIKELLEMAGHGPKKALGQNFLIDQNLIRKLIDASGAGRGDLVMEIGPGTGALTVGLLERGCRVVACELDGDLSRILNQTLGEQYPDEFTLIQGDCLAGKKAINSELAKALGDESFVMVANLPYHAATPVMMTLMTRHSACLGMFVTIQREVVDRFASASGSKAFGTISVVAQCLGGVERIANLKPGCFWPSPGVDSAMMGWTRTIDSMAGNDQDWWVRFSEISQLLFQSRRKKIGGVVKKIAGSDIPWPQGTSPDDRIDGLSIERIYSICVAIDSIKAEME